jgi:hypothetical protein
MQPASRILRVFIIYISVCVFLCKISNNFAIDQILADKLVRWKSSIDSYPLEGVSDSEVETESLAEMGYIIVAAARGLIRKMDRDAYVETQEEQAQVVAQTDATAQGNALG